MKYLKLTAFLLLIATAGLKAQTDFIGTQSFGDHPRLLLLKGEEANIRKSMAADPAWANMNQVILNEADAMLPLKNLERIQIGKRLLDKSREGLRRIFFLSYAWRMTANDKYLKRGEQELLAISAFSDWNPTHFLDVAEMTMAVAIGYDWLYQGLSEQSRALIRQAILTKGIEPSLDTRYNSFLKVTNNWNQVCNAGIAYGAIAIYENHPELAKTIVNRSITSMDIPMKEYGPDGNYTEGYGYWGYGTTFNVLFISAIDKLFGQNFGLTEKQGFLKTAAFMENMTGSSGLPFNFFDAGTTAELNTAMFWFAGKTKDPSLLWFERKRIMGGEAKKQVKDRVLPTIMIWGAGTDINNMANPKENFWVGRGKNPVAMMRTSWTDPNAVYVGFKGGSPSLSHAHMDAGSFVMDANGVRWAMDFGMQNYESLESKGVDLWNMKQNSQRWQVMRYNNYSHNTLTVNNELQLVTGSAPIVSYAKAPAFMNATVDLRSLYSNLLSGAKRGVAIADSRYVVVKDELESSTGETTIRWSMVTPANVSITGNNRALLTKNGQKLTLQVQEPAVVTMKTWPTDPAHDYDAANPGTSIVGFEVKMPARTKMSLTVLLVPGEPATMPDPKYKNLAEWPKEAGW